MIFLSFHCYALKSSQYTLKQEKKIQQVLNACDVESLAVFTDGPSKNVTIGFVILLHICFETVSLVRLCVVIFFVFLCVLICL